MASSEALESLRASIIRIEQVPIDRVDTGAEAFNDFRRAVTKAAAGGNDVPPRQLLGGLDPKDVVLRFLIALHLRRAPLRRQIAAVMGILLNEGWLSTLKADEAMYSSLPEDLRKIAEDAEAKVAEEEVSPVAPSGGETERRSSTIDRAVEMLKKAQTELEKIEYRAVDSDGAIEAFGLLNRAVLWIIASPEQGAASVLEGLEPKVPILEFLADFYARKPKHRSRLTALCVRLMNFPAWQKAIQADATVAATMHGMTGVDEAAAKDAHIVAVNLRTASEVAVHRGGVGALYTRIVAARNLLPTPGVNPYVQVTVGGRQKRTEASAESVNPRWESVPFVFEVPSLDSQVTLEVLSSDVAGDTRLGSLSLNIKDVPRKPSGNLTRRALANVAHGELDYEIVFMTGNSTSSTQSAVGSVCGAPKEYTRSEHSKSIVAGLTSALWDLEARNEVHVVGSFAEAPGLEESWLVPRTGDGAGSLSFSYVGGTLQCPAGHEIGKRKDGLQWHQGYVHGHTKQCDVCREDISRTETRWRCHYHCEFNVCDKCYQKKP